MPMFPLKCVVGLFNQPPLCINRFALLCLAAVITDFELQRIRKTLAYSMCRVAACSCGIIKTNTFSHLSARCCIPEHYTEGTIPGAFTSDNLLDTLSQLKPWAELVCIV